MSHYCYCNAQKNGFRCHVLPCTSSDIQLALYISIVWNITLEQCSYFCSQFDVSEATCWCFELFITVSSQSSCWPVGWQWGWAWKVSKHGCAIYIGMWSHVDCYMDLQTKWILLRIFCGIWRIQNWLKLVVDKFYNYVHVQQQGEIILFISILCWRSLD